MDYMMLYGQLTVIIRQVEAELQGHVPLTSFAQDELLLHLQAAKRCTYELVQEATPPALQAILDDSARIAAEDAARRERLGITPWNGDTL